VPAEESQAASDNARANFFCFADFAGTGFGFTVKLFGESYAEQQESKPWKKREVVNRSEACWRGAQPQQPREVEAQASQENARDDYAKTEKREVSRLDFRERNR